MKYGLGIDLGTNSLGWAALKLNEMDQPIGLLDCGARIFSNGRIPKTGESNAVVRRMARQARRTRDRKNRRYKKLLNELKRQGFFTLNIEEQESLKLLDPYELRARALDEKLPPPEIGRAILHLSKRRGFKSSRKGDKESKEGKFKDKLKKLEETLQGYRSYGEYLYKKGLDEKGDKQHGDIKRARSELPLHPTRQIIEHEFDLILKKQSEFFPHIEISKLKEIIFYQRPLKSKEEDVGNCELDPTTKRAPIYSPYFQLFRVLQQVSNLKIENNGKLEEISTEDKKKITQKLLEKEKVDFDQIRTILGKDLATKFNLESEIRNHLKGDSVGSKILNKISDKNPKKKDFSWTKLTSTYDQLNDIAQILYSCESDEEVKDELNAIGIDANVIIELSTINAEKFPSSYCTFSIESLKKLCSAMIDGGFSRVDEALVLLKEKSFQKKYDL